MPRDQLETAPLYIAATRPAMIPWLGLPYYAGVVLIMAAGIIVIFAKNPLYLLGLVPVWAGLASLVQHDHNALRVLDLWSRTSFMALDAGFWGGSSPNPAPLPRGRKAPVRGVLHAV